jgi:hypothetical protein
MRKQFTPLPDFERENHTMLPVPPLTGNLASVIIPCFNQLSFSRLCVNSLLRNTREKTSAGSSFWLIGVLPAGVKRLVSATARWAAGQDALGIVVRSDQRGAVVPGHPEFGAD